MRDVRGNVDTRLRKLNEGQYDAIILAEAGMARLKIEDQPAFLLPLSIMLPAVGQGALGIETRRDDPIVHKALAPLNDPATHQAVLAERSMLSTLRGGCLAPIGAWGRITEQGQLHLSGCVLSHDGAERVDAEIRGDQAEAIDPGANGCRGFDCSWGKSIDRSVAWRRLRLREPMGGETYPNHNPTR